MKKVSFTALFCAALCILLPGCAASIYTDSREVETLELIRTVGIDAEASGTALTVSTGLSGEGEKPKLYRLTASTAAEGTQLLSNHFAHGDAFFAHTEHILIGENAARSGISGYLDYVARAQSLRLGTNVFIVRGADAADAMLLSLSDDTSASDTLTSIKKDAPRLSEGYVYSVGEILTQTVKGEAALVMAVTPEENTVLTDENEALLAPAGYAVLRDGRLLGFVTGDAASGVCILTGKAESGAVSVPYAGGRCTLMLTKEKPSFAAQYGETDIERVAVTVKLSLTLTEADVRLRLEDEQTRRELEMLAAEEFKSRIVSALSAAKELSADFCGIGGKIGQKTPLRFSRCETPWEEAFQSIPITVEVRAELKRTFDVFDPITGKDGENEQ